MCLCVCTKESTWVKQVGRKGGARAREEGVDINSSPFIESNRRPKKAICIFFSLFFIACSDFLFNIIVV